MIGLWAGGRPALTTDGRWEWGGGRPYIAQRSRTLLDNTAEASPLNLRLLHNKVDTGGFEAIALDLAWQGLVMAYVYDEQELRFVLGNFVVDTQNVRFHIAKYVTDNQEVRYIVAAQVGDDQETRYVLGNFAADDQELRHVLANFLGDDQEVRFCIAEGVVTEQELRFLLANFVPKAALARYWCDTGSGETLVDSSPYGRDGTFNAAGHPAWVTGGRRGTACLDFNRNVDDWIDLPAILDLGKGDWTIQLWVHIGYVPMYLRVYVLDQDGGEIPLALRKISGAYPHMQTFVIPGEVRKNTTPLTTETWHHVALRYRKSDGRLEFFVDGQSDGSWMGETIASATGVFRLGAPVEGTGTHYDGRMDSVEFSDRYLSDGELQAAYEDRRPGSRRTEYLLGNYITDEQELRFILGNYITDEQELRFILANFYRRDCPLYFYIAGTGIIVYEPAEGYLLDDSYIAAQAKVSRLLGVRYTIAPWPKTPVVATQRIEHLIAASGGGELPAPPEEPEYVLPGSGWYLLGMSWNPGSYKVHDQFCDDFGHVAGQYYVARWSAAAQQYLAMITPTTECLTKAVNFGEGFWVLVPSGQFDLIGTAVTGEQTVALVAGWNLVATPYSMRMDNILVEYQSERQPLNYSADKVLGVFYESTSGTGAYTTISVNSSPPDVMRSRWGYWVLAAVDCNLVFREGLMIGPFGGGIQL